MGEREAEREALEKAVYRATGGIHPQVALIVSPVGRTSARIVEGLLEKSLIPSNGVLILIGDPAEAAWKLKNHRLEPIYEEFVRLVWRSWAIVLVDNGVAWFKWSENGWKLSKLIQPTPRGEHVNEALRDAPILMALAYTFTTGTALSHPIPGVYTMAKPLHIERPTPYSDEDLVDDITSEVEEKLQVMNTAVGERGPAGRRTLAFWVAWNPENQNILLGRLEENLRDLFNLGGDSLVAIGGSSRPEESGFKSSHRYKADRKYLALTLLFELTPEEIGTCPQFSFVRKVWKEKEKKARTFKRGVRTIRAGEKAGEVDASQL
jgi:hypothetical protein